MKPDSKVTQTILPELNKIFSNSEEKLAVVIVNTATTAVIVINVGLLSLQGGSFSCLYAILHFLQILILLLLIDPFIPGSIKTYLEGQAIFLMNFNFIPLVDIPFINFPTFWIDMPQPNEILNSLDFQSGSTFVNNFSLLVTLLFLALFHVLLKYLLVCGGSNTNQKTLLTKFWGWLREKLLNLIKYTLYLRLLIESHESMLITSTSEISGLDASKGSYIVSLIFAWFIFGICLFLPALAIYYASVYWQNYNSKIKFIFMEFFFSLRNHRIARIYMTIFLSKRVFFVSLIMF